MGGFSRSFDMSKNKLCFRSDEYSASKASFHCAQSCLFIAWSKVVGSVSGLESSDSVVK